MVGNTLLHYTRIPPSLSSSPSGLHLSSHIQC
jgi:hypothetical protein